MVAIALIYGQLTAADYEDDVARDPRIDALRAKMACVENKQYAATISTPNKRSIANAVQVFFKDGTTTAKSKSSIRSATAAAARKACRCSKPSSAPISRAVFQPSSRPRFSMLCRDQQRLEATPVNEFVDLFRI